MQQRLEEIVFKDIFPLILIATETRCRLSPLPAHDRANMLEREAAVLSRRNHRFLTHVLRAQVRELLNFKHLSEHEAMMLFFRVRLILQCLEAEQLYLTGQRNRLDDLIAGIVPSALPTSFSDLDLSVDLSFADLQRLLDANVSSARGTALHYLSMLAMLQAHVSKEQEAEEQSYRGESANIWFSIVEEITLPGSFSLEARVALGFLAATGLLRVKPEESSPSINERFHTVRGRVTSDYEVHHVASACIRALGHDPERYAQHHRAAKHRNREDCPKPLAEKGAWTMGNLVNRLRAEDAERSLDPSACQSGSPPRSAPPKR